MVRMFTAIGSPTYPMRPDEIRARARRQAERAPRGTGIYRQMAAIAADGDRTPMLRQLQVPTLVIHGEVDPMVPTAHGHQLARVIPNARLELIEGWGHDLPDELAPRFAELIDQHCRQTDSR
jgi:proline iminopeptidase